jgi:dephospho-CoA kinase
MRNDPTLVITGAIGTGKSFVAQAFVSAGWAYIDADVIGHKVLSLGEVVEEVALLWPHALNGGLIDRSILAETVFSNPDALARLEAISHPRIRARINTWLSEVSGRRIIEVSVLNAIDPTWGKKLVVDALEEMRLERLIARGLARPDAMQRMRAQPPRSTWLEAADLVIDNGRQQEPELGRLMQSLVP